MVFISLIFVVHVYHRPRDDNSVPPPVKFTEIIVWPDAAPWGVTLPRIMRTIGRRKGYGEKYIVSSRRSLF
jgi:hypothetical protein